MLSRLDFRICEPTTAGSRARVIGGLVAALTIGFVSACGSDGPTGADPATAPRATIDRFSDAAGIVFERSADSTLPAAGAAIDFDARFLTRGLGPAGQPVSYYNFDAQSRAPAPIYLLFREGQADPVADQIPIVDVRPGEAGYSDSWLVHRVTVPDDFVANTVTSLAQVMAEALPIEPTTTIVNCPIVPEGSTATLRADGGGTELHQAWYRDEVVHYFEFAEAQLSPVETGIFEGLTPLSYIFVAFNINPGDVGGGPPSGFVVEPGTSQTHNVVETIPGDAEYSPLWMVYVYDNADFDSVSDVVSAKAATILENPPDQINCPVVAVDALAPPVDPS